MLLIFTIIAKRFIKLKLNILLILYNIIYNLLLIYLASLYILYPDKSLSIKYKSVQLDQKISTLGHSPSIFQLD